MTGTGRQRSAAEKLVVLRRHTQDGVPWVRLAADAGVSPRTLGRWAARFRDEPSSAGLARRSRADLGRRRVASGLVEVIEALALQRPAPTTAFVHRRVADIARDRGLPSPGYSTVRAVIAGIDPGLRTLAEKGDAAYRDRFELVWRRSAKRPNEQWQADHTELDVVVTENGKPARPWLTVIEDDHSRAVAGYTVFIGAPGAEQTALALHQAVSVKTDPAWPVCGLPDVLYSDHGSDFTSQRLERVCLDTHIQLIHSRIGVPQGRGKIERFYGTITTELLPHLPGFIPHGNGGKPVSTPTLTLAELDAALHRFIVADYNHRVHSETGQAPIDRWNAAGFIPRLPAHPEDIDLLLLTAATTRKVQRDGIRFASTRYVSPVLAAYVGEQVTVRYDPRDAAEIRVWFDDTFLCRAIAPELAAGTVTLKDLQQARSARRKELKTLLHERRSLADALPTDTRHTPPAPTDTAAPEPAAPEPDRPAGEPPRHRLHLYAADTD